MALNRAFLHSALACAALSACSGVNLTESTIPGRANFLGAIGLTADSYYTVLSDSSYRANPELLIGRVFVVRAEREAPCTAIGRGSSFEPFGRVTGIKHAANHEPKVRRSVILDKNAVAGLSALGVISIGVSSTEVVKFKSTEISAIRADDSSEDYTAAIRTFREREASAFHDENICYILIADGATHHLAEWEHFRKVEGKGALGAYGINVDGRYFSSTDDSFNSTFFGLSLSVLRGPLSEPVTSETPRRIQASELEAIKKVCLTTSLTDSASSSTAVAIGRRKITSLTPGFEAFIAPISGYDGQAGETPHCTRHVASAPAVSVPFEVGETERGDGILCVRGLETTSKKFTVERCE